MTVRLFKRRNRIAQIQVVGHPTKHAVCTHPHKIRFIAW